MGEKSSSTRSLQQQRNNQNLTTLPTGLHAPQGPEAQAGLAMFLSLSQEKEEEKEKKKFGFKKIIKPRGGGMRRCASVCGTEDTRKPQIKPEPQEEEAEPQMYGDKVATFQVDRTAGDNYTSTVTTYEDGKAKIQG